MTDFANFQVTSAIGIKMRGEKAAGVVPDGRASIGLA
jgi:hypothetical protein